jgi:hypothetical protein
MPYRPATAPASLAEVERRIKAAVYTPVAPLAVTAWVTAEPVPYASRQDERELPLKPGEGRDGQVVLAVEVKERRIGDDDVHIAVAKAREFSVKQLIFCCEGITGTEQTAVEETFLSAWAFWHQYLPGNDQRSNERYFTAYR